ncbi:MAG: CAP domain-containing protein [Nitrosopumilus sp.]|nr:CAP domain-containing protein [Nitrosopumilus sp.]
MDCNHNYLFTEGYFRCTKCSHQKYDKSYNKNNTKINLGLGISIIAIIVGLLFVNGIIEFNQENLDESYQSIPESVIEASGLSKDLVDETSNMIDQTQDEQREYLEPASSNKIIDDLKQIPDQIKKNNPLNEKPVIDKTELEILVHQFTNQYRIQHGLEPVSLDENLSIVARGHSKDMAIQDYFAHITPEGIDPTGRATKLGYNCQKIVGNLIYSGIGENIFQNNLYDTVWYVGDIPTSYDWNTQEEIAESTVDGWMNSQGHRKNILTGMFDREGIGVEIAKNDKVYITQNFC